MTISSSGPGGGSGPDAHRTPAADRPATSRRLGCECSAVTVGVALVAAAMLSWPPARLAPTDAGQLPALAVRTVVTTPSTRPLANPTPTTQSAAPGVIRLRSTTTSQPTRPTPTDRPTGRSAGPRTSPAGTDPAADRPATLTISSLHVGLPADVFTNPGYPRLVLISCGGPFDSAERSYGDNVVLCAIEQPAGPVG